MKSFLKSILAIALAEFSIACLWRVQESGHLSLFFVHLAGLSIFFAGGSFSMVFVKKKFNQLTKRQGKSLINGNKFMNPRTIIRKLYDKRRQMEAEGDLDEYDILFGKESKMLKAVIEYLVLKQETLEEGLKKIKKM